MNNNLNMNMIKKISIFLLCLFISSCSGFTSGAGLKFRNGSGIGENLKDGTYVMFQKPLGKCGASIKFFGILVPIIPVWFSANSCEKSFDIEFAGSVSNPKLGQEADIKLRYGGVIYYPVAVEKLTMLYGKKGEHKSEYGRKFKFKINSFQKFKMADDKAIIISGKTKDGKKFTEEIPVKWGVMNYNNWAVPGV